MIRTLFLVICLFLGLGPQARASIEIYANGQKYDSMQAYAASKKAAEVSISPTPVSLNSQQQEDIRREAQQLGIDVDFSKVKTFQIGQKKSSDAALHKLYVLSVENGMVGALRDFYQAWGQSDFQMARRITSEQLQEAIEQEVTTSKVPKLLIAEPGKVRIMSLTAQDSSK
jgi:hypothetical protein